MAIKRFDSKSMMELDDGSVGVAVDQAIRQMYLDIEDRPALKTARTMTLTLTMKPVIDDRKTLKDVRASIDVKTNVPKKGVEVIMHTTPKDGGGLIYNSTLLDTPDGITERDD